MISRKTVEKMILIFYNQSLNQFYTVNMYKTHFNPDSKTWQGVSKSPVFHPTMSLGKRILSVLSQRPKHVGQISDDSGIQLTNEEIERRIIRIAMNLQKMGYSQKDMFGVVCKNSENLSSVVFACSVIGAPINTLDPVFTKFEICHMFNKTKPKLVFCDFDNFSVVQEALKEINLNPEIITLIERVDGIKFIEDLISEVEGENEFLIPELDGDASKLPAFIVCSSGTTGLSKGVALSHSQMINLCLFDTGEDKSNSVYLCFSSLYWLSGVSTLISGTLTASTRIITTTPFTPELALKMIEKYKVSYILTAPSHLGLLLNSPMIEKTNLASVKHYFCAGSALPKNFFEQMKPKLPNGVILNGYGCSEICSCISVAFGSESSIGILAPNIVAKIISLDGLSLGMSENGEICAKSMFSFLGYYGDESQTKSILDSDGWIHTGDLGHFDEDGNLCLVGRIKDILKYKNFQISPLELEDLISKHPGVSVVSIVGIPDLIATDLPAAVIVKRENSRITEEEIYNLVANNFADFKKLRGGVYFVDDLPMTVSGKIKKNLVKELAIKLYNAKQQ